MEPNLGTPSQTECLVVGETGPAEAKRRAAERTAALAESRHVKPSLCWAYYAFIFSLPIEMVSIGIPVSVTRLIGYFFFLMALLNPGVSFRRIPTALWWFGAYVCTYAILGLFQPMEYTEDIYLRVFTLIQLLALFWISFNLLRFPGVARGALLTLSISCAFCAAMQVSGIGGPAVAMDEGRTAAFGQNPNEVANYFAVGLVALVCLVYGRNARRSGFRPLAWLLLAVLGLAIVQTGSRGGLVAVTVGLVTFMLGGEGARPRLRNVLIVAVAIGLFLILSVYSETSRRRWEAALTAGNLAHREQLYPEAVEMFLEQPLLGWGPVSHDYELGWRTSHVKWANPDQTWRSTHNVLLHVATATGLLGLIPFLIGAWLCFRAAWGGRRGLEGILPFALVMTVLVANMSGNWIHFKILWFIMAYALASGSVLIAWRPFVRPGESAGKPGRSLRRDPLVGVSRWP
jgi:O-antigen ligase